MPPVPSYPPARRDDVVDVLHGHRVADPYRWLEDPASQATRDWALAQDELLAAHRARWATRPAYRARLAELLGAGSVDAPVWRGERSFRLRRRGDQEHGVLLVTDPDGSQRTLVDPLAVDASGATTLDAWQPSKEGDLLAYQLSSGGTEESLLRVVDVTSGELVDGPLDRVRYSPVAWLPGAEAFFYVRRLAPELVPAGEEQYHRRVWLHRLGTDPAADVLIHGEGADRTTYFGVSVSWDSRWLVVTAAEGTAPRNDVWLADLHAAPPPYPELVEVQRGVDARTGLHVGRDGRLYVLTDAGAPRGRLAVTDPTRPTAEHWVDLVPEDPEAVLEDFAVLDRGLPRAVLLVSRTRHAISELSVHDLADGHPLGTADLPGLGTIGGLSEHPEGGSEAFFGWTDAVTPPGVLRYDGVTATVSTWEAAPGAADVPAVHVSQQTYSSADGTLVRMLVAAPEAQPSRPRPTVLYGYGGFGISMTPGFSAGLLAWVEAGGVYAIASLRGGGEEGEQWHRAGMREHKHAVFDDLHAAAEHLIARGWTSTLGISGGSNGGLLVGAAMTQRPELYQAVVCSAPLLDMVRYERFGLGVTWNDEYGSAERPDELAWLLSYSPYHAVREGVAYPAVLLTVFDGDTRVDPLHARKMCAALQHATASPPDTAPVLLRRERDVGHGARAVSRSVELSADVLAFLHAQLANGGAA